MQASDQMIPDLDDSPFEPLGDDQRLVEAREEAVREGQGAFRARLLDAYGRSCAITGEHTQPVLDAAHIQRYLGPRSDHLQNGLLLTNEFHTLFDLGYVTVTPDYVVRVSPSLKNDWRNGKRYYPYDGKPLAALPEIRGFGQASPPSHCTTKPSSAGRLDSDRPARAAFHACIRG